MRLWDRAEHALRPSEERAHGAGLLLAEVVIGVGNGLHSKASLVLPLLLQEDVLDPSKVKPATEVCALYMSECAEWLFGCRRAV